MKKGIRRYIYALLMTLLTTALLTVCIWLGSLAFGTKCNIYGVIFSMAFFCMFMFYYDEFKDW